RPAASASKASSTRNAASTKNGSRATRPRKAARRSESLLTEYLFRALHRGPRDELGSRRQVPRPIDQIELLGRKPKLHRLPAALHEPRSTRLLLARQSLLRHFGTSLASI